MLGDSCSAWQHGLMRNGSSQDKPRICEAIDTAITESGLSGRAVANELGVPEVNLSRWRKSTVPDREIVVEIEAIIERPLGYISRLAGYVEDVDTDDLIAVVEQSPQLNDIARQLVIRLVREMIEWTAEQRNE